MKPILTREERNFAAMHAFVISGEHWVFSFAQTHIDDARLTTLAEAIGRGNDDEHCLNMVASTGDQESRCIQREMAAEWLRLADGVRRPRKLKQMQMG